MNVRLTRTAPPPDGVFLNKTINFMGLGLALYSLASLYEYLSRDPIVKRTVKCRYCKKRINEKVGETLAAPPPFPSSLCVTHPSWPLLVLLNVVAGRYLGKALRQLQQLARRPRGHRAARPEYHAVTDRLGIDLSKVGRWWGAGAVMWIRLSFRLVRAKKQRLECHRHLSA